MFRHKVLSLLRRRGLLSLERIELLLSWRRSGFSVHNRVFAHPGDGRDFEALVRYMMRSPVSLSRLRFTRGAKEVVYTRKGGHDASEPGEDETVDADEFVARVLVQIPDPRRQGVSAVRQRLSSRGTTQPRLRSLSPPPPERAALRRRWAKLIRRVYEVDPLDVEAKCELSASSPTRRSSSVSWTISASATGPRGPLLPASPSRWPALLEVRPIPSEDERDGRGESCRPGTSHRGLSPRPAVLLGRSQGRLTLQRPLTGILGAVITACRGGARY